MRKDCPICGLANPGNATRCDCGFDFESATMETSFSPVRMQGLWIGALGLALCAHVLHFLGAEDPPPLEDPSTVILALSPAIALNLAIVSAMVYLTHRRHFWAFVLAGLYLGFQCFPLGFFLFFWWKPVRRYCWQKRTPRPSLFGLHQANP